MRFLFKTDYNQDIRLLKHEGKTFWYGVLGVLLLLAPVLLTEYHLSQMVFVLIYSIAALGLMLLSGFTGQVSIGHAAFLAVGAYTEAYLASRGWPFVFSLSAAAALSAATGVIIGLPALRTKGMYLAIATLAFGFIVEEIVTRAEGITGGSSGMTVDHINLFGISINSEARFYYLALAITVGVTLVVLNILRSPTGRAFVAVRDSEISAQSMGINLARYKTTAFAVSAALAGIAGALYAHKIRFISPEQFTFVQSIELLMMIVIGGLGFVHGAFFGAAFWIITQQLIVAFKDYLPDAIAYQTGLQPTIFGIILIGFVLYEPMGLYGRWLKIRTYLELFPFYRRGMFKRQKSYMKSERMK